MKPSLASVLQAAAAGGDTSFLGLVVRLGLDDYDHGAARRAAEAELLEPLVERGAAIAPAALAASLREALATARAHTSLSMADLNARLDTLREAVIELQAWLEEQDGDDQRVLLRDVWRAERDALAARARMAPNW